MVRLTTLLGSLLLFCLPFVECAGAAPVAGEPVEGELDDRLATLFAAAETDPAQVVPLIIEASLAISQMDGDDGHALALRLEPFSHRAFFTPKRLPDMERLGLRLHSIASGEYPSRIAKRYGIGSGLLAYLNDGYDERRLQAGQKLKVIDLSGEDRLVLIVDRERHRVSAWCSLPAEEGSETWVLMAYIPVGLGATETPTPTGSTRITSRVLDPEWTDPVSGQVFAPKDPGNLLGGYWMALDAEGLGGRRGIGFHGYTGEAPEQWLGKDRSNGCVRMLQRDIDRVFHLAVEGTTVQIVL